MENRDGEYYLSESDARALVRLLADVAVTPGGIMAQKRRLMEGLSEMVNADYWLWTVSRLAEGVLPTAVSLLHNLSDNHLALMADDNYSNKENLRQTQAVMAMSKRHEHWTRTVEQIFEVDHWQDTDLFRWYRDGLDFEHSVFSIYRLPGRLPEQEMLMSGVGFHRGKGSEPFSQRELRMIHIIASEVEWLHHMGVPDGEDGQETQRLSPRLRTVLTMLMDGQVPKQIARNLHLSEHTVRGYIKDIYRHFDVSGRPELLRKFMVGDGGDLA